MPIELAPTFFLEPTPKRYKKARKQVVQEITDDDNSLLDESEKKPSTPILPISLEARIDQTLTELAIEWKQQAMKAVFALIKTTEAVETGVTPISHIRYKELEVKTKKVKEVARGKQAHIVMLTWRIAKLQSAFCEQEAQAILLDTAYRMCEKPKEVKDLIFTKYLKTLCSKVEEMTRIMELEGLLESNGIAVSKRSDGMFTRAFTEVVQAQLGELSRILSATEKDGPTSSIALTAEEHIELIGNVPLHTKED
ncbi:hypothetical protein R1sor_018291 [Riccia sorocarpa]|uniref:Uncharacterized protein n=1 Tax=Riccia sorocarpa TaxID=122646 RepID=A0ABD3IAZ5_9MARC